MIILAKIDEDLAELFRGVWGNLHNKNVKSLHGSTQLEKLILDMKPHYKKFPEGCNSEFWNNSFDNNRLEVRGKDIYSVLA